MNNTDRLVQLPPGVQCFLGEEARRRRKIEETVVSVFEGWDYEEIIPPLYDYAEVFAGPTLQSKTFSFLGRDGSLFALRPDFTSLLAKIAAGRLRGRQAPIRLYYSGEILRYQAPRAGSQSELHQMGLERLGGASRTGDVEVLAVAAECLARLGVRGAVLSVGHVGVFSGLTRGIADGASLDRVRDRVEARDKEGTREACREAGVPADRIRALEDLAGMAGDASLLGEARRSLAFCPEAAAAAAELAEVTEALGTAGLGAQVAVDLGEVRGLEYYTGLVFRLYAPGLGFELGGGGRYDALLERFGRSMPAVGFMLSLDRLASLLDLQRTAAPVERAAAQVVDAAELGPGLAIARGARERGARVRFGEGEAP